MLHNVMAQIRQETLLASQIGHRDRVRRLTAELLMVIFLWFGATPGIAIELGVILLGFEILAGLTDYRIMTQPDPYPVSFIASSWMISFGLLVTLCYPAIVLAYQGSTPLLLASAMWLFGTLVHVSNTYPDMPYFRWTLSVPPVVVAVFLGSIAVNRSYGPAAGIDIFLMLGTFAIYWSNTYETMKHQGLNKAELRRARTEAQDRLAQLEHLSRLDPLTNLKNRSAFDAVVDEFLTKYAGSPTRVTVFLIDLDGFKPINDSYSHAAGDAILCEIAVRLKSYFGKNACVARLGGDEFAIVSFQIPAPDTAIQNALDIVDLVGKPITFGTRQLTVGCSIGLSRSTDRAQSSAKLLNQADQAMYQAKEDAGSSVKLYDAATFPVRPTLDDRTMLIEAMANREILPFYQPKVNLKTGEICGMEALSRWCHPTRGLVMPGEFIPMINELSLQSRFLTHTLRTALDDIRTMLDAGLNPGQVSVNLPEVTLATISARDSILGLLSAHPDTLPYLTFEVTEDIFIARSGSLIQQSIQQFRRMGVRISFDDFGTGFASFQNLRELEFDELKLDTAFVRGLGADRGAEVLVKAFLDIGHGLDVDVIAEGVETELHRELLIEMGCTAAQGFLFGRAVPFADLRAQLEKQQLGPSPRTSAA